MEIEEQEHIGTFQGTVVAEDDVYVLWVEDDDGTWTGLDVHNDLRFVNHSSSPNSELEGQELYALRRIAPGEEVTFHYGDEWLDVD